MNGVAFGTKHSYKDWGLILKSRPEISPPLPKTIYVDIPASNGQIDLTESLTGDVKYQNRKIKFEFIVLEARRRWSTLYSEILNYMHGKNMSIVFDEDISFCYEGRITVNEWKSDKKTSTIIIEADVHPFKMERSSSLEDWEWDSFNFESGVIRDNLKNIQVDGSAVVTFDGSTMPVVPTFIISSTDGNGMHISLKEYGSRYGRKDFLYSATLPDGTIKNPNFVVREYNRLAFEGNGTVSIEYKGGML